MSGYSNQAFVETDYDIFYIRKITPYLNKLKDNKGNLMRMKARGFAWYYVFNGNIKADAYRRAYYSRFDRKIGKLVAPVLEKETSKQRKSRNVCLAIKAATLFNLPYIQTAISLIRKDYENKIKKSIPQSMLQQLIVQATYDPSMFFTPNGKIAFQSWDDIPVEYRCCVEGIETKAYGQNAATQITTIKLCDREKARKYLLRVCPGLLETEKMEITHQTLDGEGNLIGIDFKKLSDDDLIKRYNELKSRGESNEN